MKNCLNCQCFSHKADDNGYITAERVCSKGLFEVMNGWFRSTLPYNQTPELKCCVPKINTTQTTTVRTVTQPLGFAEVSSKLKLRKNKCYAAY